MTVLKKIMNPTHVFTALYQIKEPIPEYVVEVKILHTLWIAVWISVSHCSGGPPHDDTGKQVKDAVHQAGDDGHGARQNTGSDFCHH